MMSLSSDKRPKGDPLTHSQDTLLGCPDQTRGVAQKTSINTGPFIPDFCIYPIYIDTTLFLEL